MKHGSRTDRLVELVIFWNPSTFISLAIKSVNFYNISGSNIYLFDTNQITVALKLMTSLH